MASLKTEELFRLVDRFCTFDQIKNLLRTAQGNENVRLSAPTKDALVQTNLRNALESHAISIDRVYDLVRDAEENGNQHIFYFEVSKKLVQRVTLDAVGSTLWGSDWRAKKKFPVFDLVESKFVYADFRLWNPDKKPGDWVLKRGNEIL